MARKVLEGRGLLAFQRPPGPGRNSPRGPRSWWVPDAAVEAAQAVVAAARADGALAGAERAAAEAAGGHELAGAAAALPVGQGPEATPPEAVAAAAAAVDATEVVDAAAAAPAPSHGQHDPEACQAPAGAPAPQLRQRPVQQLHEAAHGGTGQGGTAGDTVGKVIGTPDRKVKPWSAAVCR